jgi:fatty acid desaturase
MMGKGIAAGLAEDHVRAVPCGSEVVEPGQSDIEARVPGEARPETVLVGHNLWPVIHWQRGEHGPVFARLACGNQAKGGEWIAIARLVPSGVFCRAEYVSIMTPAALRIRPVEWPTIGLIATVYLVLAALVWFHASLPWWIILPAGAYCAALHSSLQHEVLHGHPTRYRILNEVMVWPTPTFWLPYFTYRNGHLKHHNDLHLTCPVDDPESYYLLPDHWAEMPGLKRKIFQANHTLAGRMVLGPAISIVRIWADEVSAIARGDRGRVWNVVHFAIGAAATVLFVVGIAGMPFWQYCLLIAYPGISLALVRSYCEHQAAEAVEHRTIIVEASPFWSLLFLNNNLHVAHHTRPALPWYRLPAYYQAERQDLLTRNNHYLMKGYGEIFRLYFLKAKEPIPYPNLGWLKRK